MKILKPNIGEEFVLIAKQHFYVRTNDTKQKLFLKEIKISPGQYTWEWISLRTDRFIDLEGINDNYCSFNYAINKAINDPYSTVYEFNNYEEMIKEWKSMRYIDSITTIYKSEDI